jgi:hypothetical protein
MTVDWFYHLASEMIKNRRAALRAGKNGTYGWFAGKSRIRKLVASSCRLIRLPRMVLAHQPDSCTQAISEADLNVDCDAEKSLKA